MFRFPEQALIECVVGVFGTSKASDGSGKLGAICQILTVIPSKRPKERRKRAPPPFWSFANDVRVASFNSAAASNDKRGGTACPGGGSRRPRDLALRLSDAPDGYYCVIRCFTLSR